LGGIFHFIEKRSQVKCAGHQWRNDRDKTLPALFKSTWLRHGKTAIESLFSYSKDDKAFLEDFKKHLSALRRTKHIELWDDSKIRPGEEWDDSIKTALKEADIIFLLLSKSFIDTDYIWEIEVKEAMRRHEAGEAIVVPIKAKSCDWKGLPFSKLQGLPRKDAVIDTAPNADALWTEVASEVRALIEDFWTRKFV